MQQSTTNLNKPVHKSISHLLRDSSVVEEVFWDEKLVFSRHEVIENVCAVLVHLLVHVDIEHTFRERDLDLIYDVVQVRLKFVGSGFDRRYLR